MDGPALTVFADRRLHIPADLLASLEDSNIALDRRPVRQLISSDEGELQAIEMHDGSQVPCETIVYRPQQRQTPVVIDSGVALSESGRVWIDDNYQTSIPGLFAGGDLTPGCQDALAAAAEGAKAAKNALGSLSRINETYDDRLFERPALAVTSGKIELPTRSSSA